MKFEVKEIKEINSSIGIDELSQKFVTEGWELKANGTFEKGGKTITLIESGSESIDEAKQHDAITDVSGGNYVDKIEREGDKQLEIIKDFDDKQFEHTYVYDTKNKNKVVYSGKYNALALKILGESNTNEAYKEGVVIQYKETKDGDGDKFTPTIKYRESSKDFSANFGTHTEYSKSLKDLMDEMDGSGFKVYKKVQESVSEGVNVPTKFDKALDKLDFNQFTTEKVKELAKKHGVSYEDAVEWVRDAYVINVGDKPTMAESLNESKYKYTEKNDAINDYFKGKLTVSQLEDIAKNHFGKEIATKSELTLFLDNKFMQGVMADSYGLDSKTLVKKVKELLKVVKESVVDIDEAKTVKVNFDDDSEVVFSDGTTAVMDYDGGFKYQGKYFEPDWGDGDDIEGTMKELENEMNKAFKGKVKFVFENAITKDGQVFESFDKIYNKYDKNDYWDLADYIANKKAELKRFQEKGDKNALKYTESDIEKGIRDNNKISMKNMYNQLKDAHERKDIEFLQERLRHDQKITLEFYADISGIKLPKTTKAIRVKLAEIYKAVVESDVDESISFNKVVSKNPKASKLFTTWAGLSSESELASSDDYITMLPRLEKAIIDAIESGKNDGVYKLLSDKFLNGKWFDEDKKIVDREIKMIKKYGF